MKVFVCYKCTDKGTAITDAIIGCTDGKYKMWCRGCQFGYNCTRRQMFPKDKDIEPVICERCLNGYNND